MSGEVTDRQNAVEATGPGPFDAEKIIAELDTARGRLPEAAMRQARQHRDVMVPHLVQAIQDATTRIRAGEEVDGNAHFFALFLLAEFRAREALPAILEAISLPGEGPFDLFEDAITTDLAAILVMLVDDPLALLDGLIRNDELNEYVRWEAAQAYAYLVRDGRLTRQQAVEQLRKHLRRELEKSDESLIVTGLVSSLYELAPREAQEDIKEAFERVMVDETIIGLEGIDRAIAAGETGVQHRLENLRVFDDAIVELRTWSSFADKSASKPTVLSKPRSAFPAKRADSSDTSEVSASAPPLKPAAGKRAGRNESCPCGSGKKYKKCCLDKDSGR